MTFPAVPPRECPAHILGDSPRRLHGPEGENPMALYETLRSEQGPVARVLVHGDLEAWIVLGYGEVLEVVRNPSRFARDPRTWRAMQDGLVAADHPLGPMVTWGPVCNFTDGLVHERLRSAVVDSLARFDKTGIRRYITRFANQLVDRVAPSGYADLVEDFATQLPMLVMTQLIGCPEEQSNKIIADVRDMLRGTKTALRSDQELTAVLQRLVQSRKAAPGKDLTSWLLGHSSHLTDPEVLAHVRVVLIAAIETTANLIANTLKMMLTDDGFRASLSGGSQTLPDALEAVLWDMPPINTVLGRWATGDTRLGDQDIRQGDMLLLCLAGANVDPAIRDVTARMNGNRSHLAFSKGAHECPGQDIGRAIASAGIDVLLGRLPDLQLAVAEEELPWHGSLMFRHLARLPVTFAPRPVPHTNAPSLAPTEPAWAAAPTHQQEPPPTSRPARPDRRPRWLRRIFGAR